MAKSEVIETTPLEEIEDAVVLPEMNVHAPVAPPIIEQEQLETAKAENLVKMNVDIMEDIKKSEIQIDDVLSNFINMVMNEGDASSSTKEALVNLLKAKTDLVDKKIKMVDLNMRAYLKETNTFPKYLNATQNNKITYQTDMRSLLKSVKEEQKNESK